MDDVRHKGSPAAWLSCVAVLTALAAVLRFHVIGAKSFWSDEGASVGIARLDPYNFLRILWRREANMSLYYLILHFWLRLGGTETWIRTLSLIFGVAAIPVIYWLGRRLFNPQVGVFAASLLTVNAFHLRYSQEARSYSLMVLLCLLSSLYFIKSVREPSRPNRIAYVALSSLAVYAHFYSLLLIATHWISVRLLPLADRPVGFQRAWKQIAIAVAPVILFVVTTGAGPLRWIPRPGFKEIWQLLSMTAGGGVLLILCYAAAVSAGLFYALRNKPHPDGFKTWRYRFLAMWLFIPPLFVFVLSYVRPLFLPRYFIFCLPPLLLLAADSISRIRPKWLASLALLVFMALSLRGDRAYYLQDFDQERDDWRSASAYIINQEQTGDALLFHVPMGRMSYEFYRNLSERSGPAVLYPWHGSPMTFLDFVEKPNYPLIAEELKSRPRIWLVLSHAGPPTAMDHVASSFAGLIAPDYNLSGTHEFHGIYVDLYERRAKK